jgi:hypothetical protein
MMRLHFSCSLLGLTLLPALCAAQTSSNLAEEIRNGFYSRINGLGYVLQQDAVSSPLNPGNTLGIEDNLTQFQFRPDFNLKLRQFEFDLKPRFNWTRARVPVADAGTQRRYDHEWFVNEGTIRVRPHDRLTLSYGRENLQWGPSALLSPSNPFNANNGRNNPNLELPGLNYARAVWVASPAWTVSLIDNTGKGRLDPRNRYRKARAAKIDYTGDSTFFSLIGSHAEGESSRVGGFLGWNVTDALSLHAEGSAGRGRAASTSDGPDRRDRQLLVGSAYTLEAGPTISVEYFLNKDGCDDAPILVCLQRRGALLDPLRPLARRRYAMLQYVDTKVGGNLNVSARLIRNVDDHSSQAVLNLEYELGQHWQLYAIPTYYRGARDSEFGSLLHRSLFFGASYTF